MLNVETLFDPTRQDEVDAVELASRGNRRRLRVFLATSLTVLAVGLVYTYSRPAEYRAQARIAVKTAGAVTVLAAAPQGAATATVTTAAMGNGAGSLQTEAGLMRSRPLIEAALATLNEQGINLPEFGAEPVQAIQAALHTEPVAETNIVNLTMTGRQPEHLAAILDALIAAYSRQTFETYATANSSENDTLRHELENLEQRLADKSKALEDYRQSADIVSGERDENQILARVKGLSVSLNLAGEKVAQAEGRLRSLRESLGAGKAVVRARDNPTLAVLEARASELRESLREQEKIYTPEFMAMDPNARGMRSRLTDIEAQIAEQKGSSVQSALAEAEDELAATRQAQLKLQRQIAEERSSVHAFARKFSAFKAMQDELTQLQASRRSLSERLLRAETSETSRMPGVQVVERAAASPEVWRPDYSRDAAISLAAALVAGLLAMALVELFNRPPQRVAQPPIFPLPWETVLGSLPSLTGTLPRHAAPPLLVGPADGRRELTQAEVASLLQTLHNDDLPWAILLLCGATPDEIRRIGAGDLLAESASLRISGSGNRIIKLPAPLVGRLEAESTEGNEAIAIPESDDELKRRLICAAHDAGLDDPASVTPEALRHTCVAHLVRQGLRFSDLDHMVGTLPADELRHYASLSPAGVRRTLAQIEALMPALAALGQPEAVID